MGEVITFYSYKGGTGRTMAMANVAWILAAAGHSVLAVDWDLEAPGLHRYFYPFLRDRDLVTSTGIIDIVMNFAVQATTPPSSAKEAKEVKEKEKTWHLPYADVLRHVVSIDWPFGKGRLDLLPAGQQNAAYATRVNSFNWDNFYERLGGGTFLDALRASMVGEYDYVLIDSRTGVSDTSGICTVHLPDKVVVCFTLNRQSIEGAAAVAHSVVVARGRSGRVPVQIFPIPTRVEKAETLRLDAARNAARVRFDDLLAHLPADTRGQYWDDIEIAYQPYYAYEEVLATFSDGTPTVGSLLHTMEGLAARLAGKPALHWERPAPEARVEALAKYAWVSPTGAAPPDVPKPTAAKVDAPPTLFERLPAPDEDETTIPLGSRMPLLETYWFFVSCATGDVDAHVEGFVQDLHEQVSARLAGPVSVFFDRARMSPGEKWRPAIADALAASRTVVCLVSPRYVHSDDCGRTFSAVVHSGVPMFLVPWAPVGDELPAALRRIPPAQPPLVPQTNLRSMLQVRRYADSYRTYVAALADQIAKRGHDVTAAAGPRLAWGDLPNSFAEDARSDVGRRVTMACLAPTLARAMDLGSDFAEYGASEWDWRPFGSATLRELTVRAAADESFEVDFLPADESLADRAPGVGAPVLFADRAVLDSSREASILKLQIKRSPCSLLIVPDSRDNQQTIRHTFPGVTIVRSEEELMTTVRRALLDKRADAIRKAAARLPPTEAAPLPKLTT